MTVYDSHLPGGCTIQPCDSPPKTPLSLRPTLQQPGWWIANACDKVNGTKAGTDLERDGLASHLP